MTLKISSDQYLLSIASVLRIEGVHIGVKIHIFGLNEYSEPVRERVDLSVNDATTISKFMRVNVVNVIAGELMSDVCIVDELTNHMILTIEKGCKRKLSCALSVPRGVSATINRVKVSPPMSYDCDIAIVHVISNEPFSLPELNMFVCEYVANSEYVELETKYEMKEKTDLFAVTGEHEKSFDPKINKISFEYELILDNV